MIQQTKKMLHLLKENESINDYTAKRGGVKNPRREAGLLRSRGFGVKITAQTENKREYNLLGT